MPKTGHDDRGSGAGGAGLRQRLEELLAALDRRVKRPERASEERIEADAESLRQQARSQLETLP
ncbi:MAG TPA: hypothetical protein VIL25_12130 [Vicinamibacterales bacterium]